MTIGADGLRLGRDRGNGAVGARGAALGAGAGRGAAGADRRTSTARSTASPEILAERARREAAAVDAAVAAGRDPGPLAGVPFGVKDNYDVAGRVTLAGSIVNRTLRARRRATPCSIQRLSRAGAVLVGTQNMDEFAYGFTTENAHYGATRNPLDTRRSAGGSSGGSAAAVAAGLCDFALGTDTNGSIRVPASFCGLFGLKPTFGRLPRSGTFPFVHDLDHLGLLARDTADLALVYDTIQGHDAGDARLRRAVRANPRPRRWAKASTARVALLGGWFDERADAQGREAAALVARALGATGDGHAERRRAGAGGGLPPHRRVGRQPSLRGAALARRRRSIRRRATVCLPGRCCPANPVLQAQRYRRVFHEQVMEAFREHDLLIAPATPCSATLLGAGDDPRRRVRSADASEPRAADPAAELRRRADRGGAGPQRRDADRGAADRAALARGPRAARRRSAGTRRRGPGAGARAVLINDPETLAEVRAAFDAYEQALMENDLDALDALFWHSPLTVRIGPGQNLYGIEAIQAFRANRVGGSPRRSLLRVSLTSFGRDFAIANAEFQRAGAAAAGRQSQTWVRFPEGWRVVSAHISMLGEGH